MASSNEIKRQVPINLKSLDNQKNESKISPTGNSGYSRSSCE